MLKVNSLHRLPCMSLITIFKIMGSDPVLPILKIKDGGVIITGIALFKDDKAVGTVNSDRLFYAKVMSDRYKSGTHELGFDRSKFKKIIKNKDEGTR